MHGGGQRGRGAAHGAADSAFCELDERRGAIGRSGPAHALAIRPGGAAMSTSRRGKSLLELMVILAILSVVLALSATSLTTLFRLGRQLSRDIEQGAALDRLAARWR